MFRAWGPRSPFFGCGPCNCYVSLPNRPPQRPCNVANPTPATDLVPDQRNRPLQRRKSFPRNDPGTGSTSHVASLAPDRSWSVANPAPERSWYLFVTNPALERSWHLFTVANLAPDRSLYASFRPQIFTPPPGRTVYFHSPRGSSPPQKGMVLWRGIRRWLSLDRVIAD